MALAVRGSTRRRAWGGAQGHEHALGGDVVQNLARDVLGLRGPGCHWLFVTTRGGERN